MSKRLPWQKFKIVVADHLHESGWEKLRQAEDVETVGPFKTRPEVLDALRESDAFNRTLNDPG